MTTAPRKLCIPDMPTEHRKFNGATLVTLPTEAERDDALWSPLFEEVQHAVTYKPGYELLLKPDTFEAGSRWYFQVKAERVDAITGETGIGYGGKKYLSPHACRSELTQAALGAFLAYEEHEAREFFRYDGRQVYGPHIDVTALWAIADMTEVRG